MKVLIRTDIGGYGKSLMFTSAVLIQESYEFFQCNEHTNLQAMEALRVYAVIVT